MSGLSLKAFIKGANKRVADGGADLLARAKASGRGGTVAELVEILGQHRRYFDAEFEVQLPSLENHLLTRSTDNIMMMSEVIEQRLAEVDADAAPPTPAPMPAPAQEPEPTSDPAYATNADTPSPAASADLSENDIQNLLDQEPDAAPAESPIPAPAAETPVVEEDFSALLQQKSVDEMSAEEIHAINLDAGAAPADVAELAAEAQGETGEPETSIIPEPVAQAAPHAMPAEQTAAPAVEEDFSALLQQKSIDEMSEDEIESAALKEEPGTPAAAANVPTSEQAGAPDLPATPPAPVVDELDSLLEKSFAGPPADTASPADSASPAVETATIAEPAVENFIEKTAPEAESENSPTQPEAIPVQETNTADKPALDELDALLENGQPGAVPAPAPLAETSDGLDQLLGETAPAPVASEIQPVQDLLSEVAAAPAQEAEDELDKLLAANPALPSDPNAVVEALTENEFEEEHPNTQGLLASDTDILGDDETDSEVEESSAKDLHELAKKATPANTVIEPAKKTSESEIDNLLEELPTATNVASVTDMINTLKDTDTVDDNDPQDDDPTTEQLTDLLTKATGRNISRDDLEDHHDEQTVSLSDLVDKAESSIEGEQSVRVLSETYRIERGSEVLYNGGDEGTLRKMISDHVLSGSSAELKVVKVTRKEVVRIVEDELPISVSIHS